MELFIAGNSEISNSEHFPQHIAPFPDSTDLLYPHPAVPIHSLELPELIVQRTNLPPQKLRPIRCNGRSPPKDGRYAEEKCNSVNQLYGISDDANEYFSSSLKVEVGSVTDNGAAAVNVCVANQVGMVGEEWNRNYENRVLDDEFSSSSEYADDSSVDIKEPVDRKRKRKSRKKFEYFLENMVMKLMEKQDYMHRQLIQMIEKKERERIMREEGWRQQEMERMKRAEEVRAQETARNLALISFIENILGHEEVPQPLVVSGLKDSGWKFDSQKDIKYDPNSKRWPESEVQALITLRTALDHKFHVLNSKGSIWEEISAGLHNLGYNRTPKKCKEKWENINKYFKRSLGSGKDPESSKRCPYFHELNTLYRNGLANVGNPSHATNELKKEME